MAELLEARKNAQTFNPNTVNGQHVDIAITVRGSDLYFAICAIMGVVALVSIGASMVSKRRPVSSRQHDKGITEREDKKTGRLTIYMC